MTMEHEINVSKVVDLRMVATTEDGSQHAFYAESADVTIETKNTFFRNFQREIMRISSTETTITLSDLDGLRMYHTVKPGEFEGAVLSPAEWEACRAKAIGDGHVG